MSEASTDTSSRLKGFAAGIASGLTKLATRLQCAPKGTFTGPLDALRQTIGKEGFRALYKGATPPAVGWGCSDAVLMGALHNYRLYLVQHGNSLVREPLPFSDEISSGPVGHRLTLFGHALAGAGAGYTNAAVAHPIETLKAKLQLQLQRDKSAREFSGPIACAKAIYRQNGVLGIYKGFGATLLFRSSFAAMFSGYEIFMRLFKRLEGTRYEISTPMANFLAGGMGANAFWASALPADNIKNRLMTDSVTAPRYRGVIHAARTVYAEGGLRGFYAGSVPVALRAFPTNAAALLVWETVMRGWGTETIAR